MYNCSMKNTRLDLRKIPSDELQKIKDEAIKMRDEGISNKEVAQRLKLDSSVLSRWYKKHIKNYRQPQVILKKGRKSGTQKKLSDYQELEILKMLEENDSLLDKKYVKRIVKDKFDFEIPLTTISDYLRKWGFCANFINDFKKNFIKKLSEEKFEKLLKNILSRNGMIIWIEFSEQEVKLNKINNFNLQSISTLSLKNKLVFKLYESQIQANDLINFINQISKLFTKDLYIIYNKEKFEFVNEVNSHIFDNQIYIIEY